MINEAGEWLIVMVFSCNLWSLLIRDIRLQLYDGKGIIAELLACDFGANKTRNNEMGKYIPEFSESDFPMFYESLQLPDVNVSC